MSNTRPSLNRKVTPKSEKARKEALESGVTLKIDGTQYTVRAGDLTALDARALRRELGLSFLGLMGALETDPDIDLIAGLMWLSRRVNGETTLAYDEVASDLDYAADYDIVKAADEQEADPDPEA